MKTNKLWGIMMMLVLVIGTILTFSSCGDNDDEEEDPTSVSSSNNGFIGWYVDENILYKSSDFSNINSAIRKNEVLYDGGWVMGKHFITYATRDIFITSSGLFDTYDSHCYKYRFTIDSFANVYNIINKNTIIYYRATLCEENASYAEDLKSLYSFYAGSELGTLCWYLESPNYYTYAMIDNKIVVSNGDIFTVTSSGIIKDDTSTLLIKYASYAKQVD